MINHTNQRIRLCFTGPPVPKTARVRSTPRDNRANHTDIARRCVFCRGMFARVSPARSFRQPK
eukprot:1184344-Prorocentrum_minimum.AAC.3